MLACTLIAIFTLSILMFVGMIIDMREVKRINHEYSEIKAEIEALRKQLLNETKNERGFIEKRDTYNQLKRDNSNDNIEPVVHIQNSQNMVNATKEYCGDHHDKPVDLDPKDDFIFNLKDNCKIVGNKHIIRKQDVAIIMGEYDRKYNIFNDEYMVIYSTYYALKQSGIRFIQSSKYVRSVYNDLVNNELVIEFYTSEEMKIDDNIVEVIEPKRTNVIDTKIQYRDIA